METTLNSSFHFPKMTHARQGKSGIQIQPMFVCSLCSLGLKILKSLAHGRLKKHLLIKLSAAKCWMFSLWDQKKSDSNKSFTGFCVIFVKSEQLKLYTFFMQIFAKLAAS